MKTREKMRNNLAYHVQTGDDLKTNEQAKLFEDAEECTGKCKRRSGNKEHGRMYQKPLEKDR